MPGCCLLWRETNAKTCDQGRICLVASPSPSLAAESRVLVSSSSSTDLTSPRLSRLLFFAPQISTLLATVHVRKDTMDVDNSQSQSLLSIPLEVLLHVRDFSFQFVVPTELEIQSDLWGATSLVTSDVSLKDTVLRCSFISSGESGRYRC